MKTVEIFYHHNDYPLLSKSINLSVNPYKLELLGEHTAVLHSVVEFIARNPDLTATEYRGSNNQIIPLTK
jgi:hypothetical protein